MHHSRLIKQVLFFFTSILLALPMQNVSAQLSIKIGRDGGYRSGSYNGYWNPNYTPKDFSHRMGRIEFVNEAPDKANIYHVDRYGKWTWVKELDRGEKTSVDSPIGDVWVIRGNRNTITERVVARPERQRVVIRYDQRYEGDRYGPRRDDRYNVSFRNRTDRDIVLYSLDPWGKWTWAGSIPRRGGEIEVRTYDRQQFQLTDQRGRLIESYRATRDNRRVSVDDD